MNKKRILRSLAHLVFRTKRFRDKCIKKCAKNMRNKRILEIGSGKKEKGRYYYSLKDFFDDSNEFIQSDINPEYGHKIIDVTNMNFLEKFDIIICTNVLEHVFDFRKAIQNIYEALKPDGVALFFVPGFYPLHDEPNDFWRFTEHSLKILINNFKKVKIEISGIRQYPFAYFVEAKKNGEYMTNPEIKKYDKDYYEKLEGNYRKETRWSKNRIKNIIELVNPQSSEAILDLGCATGRMTTELAKKVMFIVGLDISDLALNMAQHRIQSQQFENISLVTGKSQCLPFKESIFDKVVCTDLIEHLYLEDYLNTLNEVNRILKKNGILLMYTPNKKHFFEILKEHNIVLKKDITHIGLKTAEGIRDSLISEDFVVERVYYKESHVFLFNRIERILSKFPSIGNLFKRRICIVAKKMKSNF